MTLEILEQRVENAYQEVQLKPGIFENVRRRAESCVDMHGSHIEYL